MTRTGTFAIERERVAVARLLATILENHKFDENLGICSDTGKFEGDTLATLYFYYSELDGDGEAIGSSTYFEASTVEQAMLGAVAGRKWFELCHDDNGLVYGWWITDGIMAWNRESRDTLEGEN